MTDVFAIQDEISQAIAEMLRVRLSGDRPLVKRHTENVEAYNLYLIGRYHFFKFTPEGVAKGKEWFEKAIQLDPNCALACSGLANIYHYLGAMGLVQQKIANAQCRKATLKALELDKMLPQAHAMLAVLRTSEFEWKEAELSFRRALELGPESADSIDFYILFCLMPMRRLDEAIEWAKKAIDLDPLSPLLRTRFGAIYLLMRQYDRAIEQIHKALELSPQYPTAHMFLGCVYALIGRFDEGIRACELAASLMGRHPQSLGFLGAVCALGGRRGEAQKLVGELQGLAERAHVPAISFAFIYSGLGEIDKALDWIEKAIEERDAMIALSAVNVIFDPLRSHPRYHALLRKMNLEP